MSWIVPPEWYGETCFILGCGPGLVKAPIARLQGRHVIAINDSYLLAPWAEVLYFCDRKWWKSNERGVRERFTGRYIVSNGEHISGVKSLRLTGAEGLEDDPGGLRHGSNSGYQAINLAVHFGAHQIALLGYDMQVNGQSHWQLRDGREMAPEVFHQVLQNTMLPKFKTLVAPLRDMGVEVINCTPESALTLWPMRSLDEVLREEEVGSVASWKVGYSSRRAV